MKVTLREKKLKNGMRSLYLDFYPPIVTDGGKRTRREFLSLYVNNKPKTETQRDHNKETRQLAESIRAKRQLDLQANPHGFVSSRRKNGDFLAFFNEVIERKRRECSKSTTEMWKAIYWYLSDFSGGACTFGQLNRDFVERFRSYLLTCEPYLQRMTKTLGEKSRGKSTKKTLSVNTAKSYFERFCQVVKEAHRKNFISSDVTFGVEAVKGSPTSREFLSIDELQTLAKTACDVPDDLRRAALFSALTGLRHSDIRNLIWANLREDKASGDSLQIKIVKTGGQLTLPISAEARALLGEARKPDEKVFPDLVYDTMTNVFVRRWAAAAGIGRQISFHSFRHTYATAQITLGTDIYTVSKMLGHSDVKQTQIYARLVDERKREAANKITLR